MAYILIYLLFNKNHFTQDSFKQIIPDLSNKKYTLDDCKEQFKNANIEWIEIDEILTYYLRNNSKINPSVLKNVDDLILQLKSEINNFEKIFKISFSKTYFAKLIEIAIRIYYRSFSILQGDFGCKTSLIHFINDILSLAKSDSNIKCDIRWKFYMIDFNTNYSLDNFKQEIKDINNESNMSIKEMEINKDNE